MMDNRARSLYFRQVKNSAQPYRLLLWVALLLSGIWLLLQINRGQVVSPFLPTPTPTRSSHSYLLQAQAYFAAGKLDDPNSDADAIDTYKKALLVSPDDAQAMAELARIQTYASSAASNDQARLLILEEARDNIRRAADLAPDDSQVLAIKAFVLDWNASSNLITTAQREAYLAEAEAAANRAYLLDPDNALALAFYAEVLLDQQKWDQSLEYVEQAVERAPEIMDVHRVYATVLESLGFYNDAIRQYQRAAELAPNLTFLLLRIGQGYRNLGNRAPTPSSAEPLYDQALYYFDQAAEVNKQLGIRDPLPYIAIAKTYTQMGQFFIASRNAETALRFSPSNSDTYGQLGSIYVQARNYEPALPALRCALEGCTAEENRIAQDLVNQGLLEESVAVEPLELTNLNVAYYYIRYGSVLAYLSDAQNGFCDKNIELMARLRENFSDDALLISNVEDNEATCRILFSGSSP
jgi:tetratricopeptide (TPR) repeat protein